MGRTAGRATVLELRGPLAWTSIRSTGGASVTSDSTRGSGCDSSTGRNESNEADCNVSFSGRASIAPAPASGGRAPIRRELVSAGGSALSSCQPISSTSHTSCPTFQFPGTGIPSENTGGTISLIKTISHRPCRTTGGTRFARETSVTSRASRAANSVFSTIHQSMAVPISGASFLAFAPRFGRAALRSITFGLLFQVVEQTAELGDIVVRELLSPHQRLYQRRGGSLADFVDQSRQPLRQERLARHDRAEDVCYVLLVA